MGERVGSVLHGAYGDYYEQMICLKALKNSQPDLRLVLFFASPARLRELRVLDLSFADEIHLVTELPRVLVDRFHQFQVRDPELRAEVLAALEPQLRRQIDEGINRKPWTLLRRLDLTSAANRIELGPEGRSRLPEIIEQEGLDSSLFSKHPTVGFLWRYRRPGGAISPRFQPPEAVVRETKSALLTRLHRAFGAHIIVAGMNVRVTNENRDRVDAKFSEQKLDLDDRSSTYLRGLSWALELEILEKCSLCLVMPSGFSEALWIRRSSPTVLIDPPPVYLLKCILNRMPLFGLRSIRELAFQFRQPHTMERALAHLRRLGVLPLRPTGESLSPPM